MKREWGEGRSGERERGREGEREGGREEGREGGREGGRERGREGESENEKGEMIGGTTLFLAFKRKVGLHIASF